MDWKKDINVASPPIWKKSLIIVVSAFGVLSLFIILDLFQRKSMKTQLGKIIKLLVMLRCTCSINKKYEFICKTLLL